MFVDKRNNEIIGIQYLRGICAIAVVLSHTSAMASFTKYFGGEVLHGFLASGALGVELFFLISGFVISIVCLEGADLRAKMTYLDYAERRFARIVPLMWLAVASYAGLRMLGRSEGWSYMPYIRGMLPLIPGDIDPHNIWTLRHEFIFYILFALTFLTAKRRPWILVMWVMAPFAYTLSPMPQSGGVFWQQFVYMMSNPVNIEFITGVAIGICFIKYTRKLQINLPIDAYWILLGLFICYMLFAFAVHVGLQGLRNSLISAFICSFILIAGVHIRCRNGMIKKFGVLMGDASYAIYLFHPHFVSAILGVWSHLMRASPIGIVVIGTATLATIGGIFIHLFIEKPLVHITRQALKKYRFFEP